MTEDRIREVTESLNGLFRQVEYSLAPTDDAVELQRRQMALRRGAHKALVGALVYLLEHHPAVARALVLAGRDSADNEFRGQEACFVPRLSAKRPAPLWMMNPALIGIHRQIVATLKEAWAAPVEADALRQIHFVSKKGRFGEAQIRGMRLRQKRLRHRGAAVLDVYDSIAEESGIDASEVTEATARRWVTRDKTPAVVSRRILGTLLGKSPRAIKKMLDEAGRYMWTADEQHRILDLWGFQRQCVGKSVNPDDSARVRRARDRATANQL